MHKVPPLRNIPLRASRHCTRFAVALPLNEAVATGEDNGTLRITSVRRGEDAHLDIPAHDGRMGGIAEVTNGYICTCGLDGMLQLWKLRDTRRPRDRHKLKSVRGLTSICAIRPGRIIVGTGIGHLILFQFNCDTERMEPLGRVQMAHDSRINHIHSYRDYFITASNDNTAALWNSADCERIKVFTHSDRSFSVCIGQHHVVIGSLRALHLYENKAPNFPFLMSIPVDFDVVWRALPYSKDMIMFTGDETFNFFSLKSKALIARVGTNTAHVLDVGVLRDGRVVYAGNSGQHCGILELHKAFAQGLREYVYGNDSPSPNVTGSAVTGIGRPMANPSRGVGDKRANDYAHIQSRDPRLRYRQHNSHGEGPGNASQSRAGYEQRQSSGGERKSADYHRGTPEKLPRRRPSDEENNIYHRNKYEGGNRPKEQRQQTELDHNQNHGRNSRNGPGQQIPPPVVPASNLSKATTSEAKPIPTIDLTESTCNPVVKKPRISTNLNKTSEPAAKKSDDVLRPTQLATDMNTVTKSEVKQETPSVTSKSVELTSSEDSSPVVVPLECKENISTLAQPDQPARISTADLSETALKHWEEQGVSREVATNLEPRELAAMMAAFMLRYRLSWKEKFEPLKECLADFFDDNFITADDIVGALPISVAELTSNIIEALKKDKRIGAKMGLLNGVERFLKAITAASRNSGN